jgi:cold shock CspA family protein
MNKIFLLSAVTLTILALKSTSLFADDSMHDAVNSGALSQHVDADFFLHNILIQKSFIKSLYEEQVSLSDQKASQAKVCINLALGQLDHIETLEADQQIEFAVIQNQAYEKHKVIELEFVEPSKDQKDIIPLDNYTKIFAGLHSIIDNNGI